MLLVTRRISTALPVLLDLLLAAGLLRLGLAEGGRDLAGAAMIVLLRRLVVSSLRRDRVLGAPSPVAAVRRAPVRAGPPGRRP